MSTFCDYRWKNGAPIGIENKQNQSITYKIIADPYRKWISIEQYKDETFEKVIYDSHLLDFRHINPANQASWQKIALDKDRYLLRNQDDRSFLFETYHFQGERCRECHIHSVHHILVAVQKMSYSALGDPFDGVTLYDANQHPVMFKKYKTDETTGQFTELIEEGWDIK